MANLGAIRENLRKNIIGQPDANNSDFTDSELNDIINVAIRYIAARSQYPRTFQTDQAVENQKPYSLASNAMILRYAYFGDRSIKGDMRRLRILTEGEIRQIRPGWLSDHTDDSGEPDTIILYSRTQYYLSPPANAANSVSGKKVHISYVNYPATVSSDSTTPDLPTIYHDLVPFKAGELCYTGKLNNQDKAKDLINRFNEQYKLLEIPAQQERQDLYLSWGSYDDVEGGSDYTVIPT